MLRYKNYIFDLYGTLIDIWTDEDKKQLWENLALFYSHYGVDYKPMELKRAYRRMVKEEENLMKRDGIIDYPEIDLETVFLRLLKEAPKGHPTARLVKDEKEWVAAVANIFRIESYKKIKVYKNAEKVLKTLKERKCGVYLLSNAQRVFTVPELERLGLAGYFDKIYISSDMGIKKPDPKFMQSLLSAEGLNKDKCIMVGNDMDSDIAMAKKLQMPAVLVNTFHYSKVELWKKDNQYPVINDLKELLE
ncbi:MAG: HAD family hydrolase [Lachnospiraceae bacterium]|nr:HAD family hydrolase [Lachnospiraceae bacterium]